MSTKKSYKIFLYKIQKYSSYWTTMIVKNIIASGIWEKFPLGIISRCTSLFSFYENRERRLIWSLRARVKYSLSVIFSLWTLSHRQSSFIIGTRCLSQPCNFGILNTQCLFHLPLSWWAIFCEFYPDVLNNIFFIISICSLSVC